MPMEQEIGCWDSVLLENLTEENFINNLQQRFKRDNIYTYIGTYLVSINPYKPIAIYSSDLIEKYGRKSLFQLPPHIYAISNLAYQGLQDYNEDQCIILSGESGSGKTESSRIIIHFLTEVSEIKTRFKTTPNKYKKIISNGSNPEIYPILSKRNTTTGCIKFDAGSGNSVKKCSREKSVDFDFSHHKSVENLSSKCSSHPLTLNSKISKSIEGNDSLVNLNKKCSKHCGSGVANKTTEFQNKLFNNYNDTNCIEICPKSYKINKNILKDSDELAQSTCNRVNSIKTITPDEQQQFSQKSNIIASKQCCQKDMCTLPSKFKLSSSSSSSINKTNKNTFLSDPHAGGSSNIKVLKLTNSSHNCEIDANKMRERVAQAEIFLEAMGNAETQKNSNSSRFGRFFDIEFDFKGDPLSGHITYYMLEKSRVTRTNHNERNFHIFYQLLSGADIHLLKTLKLQRNIDKYELLKYGAVNDEDKFKFPFTFNSLEQLGLFPDEISSIFKIIAVVLKLGNLVFMSTTNIDGTEGTDISNDYELHEISQLLGLDEQLLFNCLTKSGVNWNHLDNGAELDAKNASSYRFILCRTLYGRLFTWIVNRINESLKFKQYKRGKNLGILDFYGFEILENNSYEQLVINYCNERFQQHFVQFVLKYQQDLYNREGLDWIKIDYFDNLSICELIDRPNHGIMSLLDEPQVTCDGTFSTRLNQCCSGHTSFLIQDSNIKNSSFQIRHYAGPVTYSTIGFIEKNLDNLPKHISSCLYQCRLSIVQNLFPEGNPKKSTKKPSTLSSSLRTSLQTLLSLIENRKSHYVFCMKPNERKQQKVFELALIQHQVRYLSLLPLAQLWRSGHYFNMSHNKFLNRYKLLSNLTWPHYNKDNVVESIAFVIRSIPLPAAEFTIGRKNVFIRSPRTVHELEEFRKSRLDYLAILIQKTFRCYYQRKHFLRMKKSQILIASAWKMWRECRFGISFRGKKHLWGLYRVAREEYRLIKYRKQVEWAVGVLQRHHIQWQKKQFLLTLMLRLPTNCNSPLCMDWPTAPRFLAETSQLLMNIHHRWRCHMYRKKFDQTSRNRMREKVTASIIFKDRKSSYARSVSHPFIGDYVRLRQNVQWKKICVENNDQYVVFADIINKITRSSGKFVPILLVLSTSSMLLLDQRTLQIKYRVPAAEIYRMSLSPYLDDIAVFHIKADNNYFPNQLCETDSATGCLFQSEYGKKKGDFVFQTGHVIEIVTKLFLVIQNATSKPPEVHISTEFEANFGQQTVVFTFKCGGLAELAHGQARVARKGNRMEVIV